MHTRTLLGVLLQYFKLVEASERHRDAPASYGGILNAFTEVIVSISQWEVTPNDALVLFQLCTCKLIMNTPFEEYNCMRSKTISRLSNHALMIT